MAHTEALQEQLYQEIISHLEQTDVAVPHRKAHNDLVY